MHRHTAIAIAATLIAIVVLAACHISRRNA